MDSIFMCLIEIIVEKVYKYNRGGMEYETSMKFK